MRLFSTAVTLVAAFAFALPAFAADVEAGKAKYDQLCANCHGTTGKGDGPTGAALDPQPRDMTDPEWQESTSDEKIAKVIQDGGAASGLSPLMPPFGGSLSDQDVENLVAYIRSFGE